MQRLREWTLFNLEGLQRLRSDVTKCSEKYRNQTLHNDQGFFCVIWYTVESKVKFGLRSRINKKKKHNVKVNDTL